MLEVGLPLGEPSLLAEAVAVSNIDEGCYGVTASIRATFDSLMNTAFRCSGR